MNRKLPRTPKKDRSEYVTGDAQNWTYEYTAEDLAAVQSIEDCPTEPMPTYRQIFEYGVLTEMLNKLESELGSQHYIDKIREYNKI